jgi:eukaryotic-like serine/threonine-protein kinase
MVDQRSDIFALGIVLFETLTGRTPFSDESPLKLMLDVVQSEIPDVREINREVDQEVASILKRMLEKDPNDRYQNTDALIAELEKHPLIAQGGTLKLKTLPPAGPAATLIGIPTPMTPAVSRAPTAPPSISNTAPPAASLPQHTPAKPTTPPPLINHHAATRPGVTNIRAPQAAAKSTSGGKIMLLLGVAFAGMLLIGGAWAVWGIFAAIPNPKDMVVSTQPDTPVVIPDADAQLSSPSLLPNQTTAPDTAASTANNDGDNDSVNNASANDPQPVVQSTKPTPSTDDAYDTIAADDPGPDPIRPGGGSKTLSVAVVTNGDPALMIPAQQILEDKLEEEGFDVVDSPQNATFVLRVKSDRIGSQELSFYGQTAVVTTAYLSVKMIGPGGRAIGATMREKIDYTPLNAEDKVQQAFDGGLGSMRQATKQ